MFEDELKANPDPVEADAMTVTALVEVAVTALDEFGEAMAGFIMAGGPRTSLVAALRNHQATMALVLRRLGRIARATLDLGDTQSALTLDLVGRIEALETALGVRPWDDPGPTTTVRLGPALAKLFSQGPEDPTITPEEAARRMGFDGPVSTIEIPPFDQTLYENRQTVDEPETSAQFEVGWDGLARRKKPKGLATDYRVVYGATCSWWETIDQVATRSIPGDPDAAGLPCCPHCRGVLYEVESEAVWLGPALDQYEAAGRPGYRAMIEWGRGKCFRAERPGERPMDALRRAYEAETGTELTWTAL